MHKFKHLILNTLVKITGSSFAQNMLLRISNIAMFLQGYGAGVHADSSGERALAKYLRKNHKKDEKLCIFDVGANKGQFLSMMQEELGDFDMSVYCFEPSAEAFKALNKNCILFKNVMLNNFALGEKVGEATLYSTIAGSGLASLTKRDLRHIRSSMDLSETVKIDTIDNYCLKNHIGRIDLLKLDVEGHEMDVLKGGCNKLKSGDIKILMFEFGGCNIDTHIFFRDFYYYLTDLGFQHIYRIAPSEYCVEIEQYTEFLEQFRTTNYIASYGNKRLVF